MATKRAAKNSAPAAPPAPPSAPPAVQTSAPAASGLLTRVELGAALGVTPAQILRYQNDGMPIAVRGGRGVESKYRLTDVLRWWRERESQRLGSTGGATSLEVERARLARAQSEKTELDLRVRRGEVAELAEVEREWGALVTAVRTKLLLLPGLLVQTGLVEARREADARVLIEDPLRELAGGKLETATA